MAALTSRDCAPCGLCCSIVGVPPGAPAWRRRLPRELEQEINRAVRKRDFRGEPCIWHEAGVGCRHYDLRPPMCVEFEVGGADCLRVRERAGFTTLTVNGS